MTVNGEITRPRVVVRRLDARDVIRVADAGNVLRDIGPRRTAVATNLHVAVVSADPQHTGHFRRLADRDDVTVAGVAVMLRSHRLIAGHAHDREGVAIDLFGEIVGRGPGIAAVQRLEQTIAADVEQTWVVRRHNDRRVPVEAKDLVRGRRRYDV